MSDLRLRVAVLDGRHALPAVQRYLPENYEAQRVGPAIVIVGTDVAGWTLDGYVIPRLASGLYFAREFTEPEVA